MKTADQIMNAAIEKMEEEIKELEQELEADGGSVLSLTLQTQNQDLQRATILGKREALTKIIIGANNWENAEREAARKKTFA